MLIDAHHDVTGLVLAGGRGSRMGGVDKGLQPYRGQPLVRHAVNRLAPQVGGILINANRNMAQYAAMGFPVWVDGLPDFPGPLAGMLAGLAHCATPFMVSVPCDTPHFPTDLVARLAAGLAQHDSGMATACTRSGSDGQLLPQPVFCLMHVSLLEPLRDFILAGERKTGAWSRAQRSAQVVFDDETAFLNINTREDLERS